MDKMYKRKFIVRLLSLLVFKIGIIIGFDVIYKINSPECGTEMVSNTIDMRLYGLNLENISSFIFSVKSKKDTAIIATDTQNSQIAKNFYLLYIGGSSNTWCTVEDLRYGLMTTRKMVYGSFANNTYYVPFWYSWTDGKIQAGLGETIGVNTFIVWNDSNPFDVHGIGITTCHGATGECKVKINVQNKFGGYFSKCGKSNTRSELSMMENFTTSRISCAGKCATYDNCFGFNYHLSNRCELLSLGNVSLDDIMRNRVKRWDFYAKCYDGKGVCVGCYF